MAGMNALRIGGIKVPKAPDGLRIDAGRVIVGGIALPPISAEIFVKNDV